MNFPLSVETISGILGPYGPVDRVRANWPLVESALDRAGIYSDLVAVAAIATIAVETGSFSPVRERGGPAYLAGLYEGRKDLGNDVAGDGVRFCGRGFIQITGRWDYTHFGKETGHDLAGNPELAMDPTIAADVLARFFKDRGVPQFAEARNWSAVRRRVNGGMIGWQRFSDAVTALVAALDSTPAAAGNSTEVIT